jgi:hypothetical protein
MANPTARVVTTHRDATESVNAEVRPMAELSPMAVQKAQDDVL